jgi:dolichyl-phosphate beta-glucosyltransferase
MNGQTDLSIVVPAYNEEKIIKISLEKIVGFLKKKKYSWEVVVVDDGSQDSTSEVVSNMKNTNIKLVRLGQNRGKGGALREGMLKAKGKIIVFMDADLSVPLTNIDKFYKELKNGTDVVIASRRTKGAKIAIHQPWHREKMGQVFTALTRLFIGTNTSDFTCGFKGFRHEAARKIFKNLLINRWAYDAEIIFLAEKFDYQVKELPIEWKNRIDTRVRLSGVVLETLRDLLKIRMFDLQGHYDN